MSSIKRILLASGVAIFSAFSFAQEAFVSDSVYTYLHTGPSAKFRILGSINAGSSITIVEQSEDKKYTKVVDSKGREGWIMSEFVSTQESLKQRYDALESRLNNQLASNENLSRESTSVKEQIVSLQQRIDSLTGELAQAKTDVTAAQEKLKGEDEEIKIQWFTRGGIMVFASFLVGVIVCSLSSRKKKRSGW
ncbi:MAG: TIGR04211 family SH3 domain-containing protein [Psychrobium sp.]